MTVPPLEVADFAECLALLGGFFADMEGDGDEEGAMPFVWMPAGMGRFVLGCGGMTGGGMGVVLGAMTIFGNKGGGDVGNGVQRVARSAAARKSWRSDSATCGL